MDYKERRIWRLHEQIDRRTGIARIPQELRVAQLLSPYIEMTERSEICAPRVGATQADESSNDRASQRCRDRKEEPCGTQLSNHSTCWSASGH